MALILARKSASGAKAFSSHGPKVSSGTVVSSLKSRQPPQTMRVIVASGLRALSSGRTSSTTPAIASRDSLVVLSPSYLHRHSRHTRSNDILPFASSTAIWRLDVRLRALFSSRGEVKAEAEASSDAKRRNFIVNLSVVA